MEIRFKVQSEWNEECLLRRICDLIEGSQAELIKQDSGYDWMLGASNDWKAEFDQTSCEVIVAYRYGTPEKMQLLRNILMWRLDVEHLNAEEQSCTN